MEMSGAASLAMADREVLEADVGRKRVVGEAGERGGRGASRLREPARRPADVIRSPNGHHPVR